MCILSGTNARNVVEWTSSKQQKDPGPQGFWLTTSLKKNFQTEVACLSFEPNFNKKVMTELRGPHCHGCQSSAVGFGFGCVCASL